MDLKASAERLCGEVNLPSSKSAAHRAVIAAALAQGQSRIDNVTMCDDIVATIGAVGALGCTVSVDGDCVTVKGITAPQKTALIDCKESGSTARFMIPIAAAYGTNATFIGSGRLPQRPLDDIISALSCSGISFKKTTESYLPLEICGTIDNGPIYIAGNVSSQYLTGLLFACAVKGGSVELTTALESAAYVDMTCDMLKAFGAEVKVDGNKYTLNGKLQAQTLSVEGDWSAAAFFFEAAALGGKLKLFGLDPHSRQADRACVDVFASMGVDIDFSGDSYILSRKGVLKATDMDASQCPDLVPAVAVAMAFAEGTSTIYNAGRLRIKESDRLKAVANGLLALGINTDLYDDRLVIYGGKGHGGEIDSCNDHRIAMAFACAAGAVQGDITIKGADSVSKSYPQFFEVFKSIGGKTDVISNR